MSFLDKLKALFGSAKPAEPTAEPTAEPMAEPTTEQPEQQTEPTQPQQ